MTERPGNYTAKPPPTVAQLKSEIYALVELVSRRPGSVKLLLGLRQQALIFSQYKQNRSYRRVSSADRD
jgi:hypothetical protein